MHAHHPHPEADRAFHRLRLAQALLPETRRAGPSSGLMAPSARIALGLPALDEALQGGLPRAALHEVHAVAAADAAAAGGFTLALARRAAGARPILLVRQDCLDGETGAVHPAGLPEFGIDPARFLLVKARDVAGLLQAGVEAARCPALGAVLLEFWGDHRAFDLTASRRLALAAQESGLPIVLTRVAAPATPSAAVTRWQVQAGLSRALLARAPGPPCFRLSLLKHRQGLTLKEWCVEWNRDRAVFEPRQSEPRHAGSPAGPQQPAGSALSRVVPALPLDRDPAGERADPPLRRAG